ncbi:hypothetical protein QL285_047930 [Trifolium repens]|nr:hypothetical protein QL285_047930 [Trifolium repens]
MDEFLWLPDSITLSPEAFLFPTRSPPNQNSNCLVRLTSVARFWYALCRLLRWSWRVIPGGMLHLILASLLLDLEER